MIAIIALFLATQAAAMPRIAPEGDEAEHLVAQLSSHPWRGVDQRGEGPAHWDYGFTEPMQAILKMGSPAQTALLAHIGDQQITDQVVILLGGLGDERAIGPIIGAMKSASGEKPSTWSRRVLTAGNLALTNLTVADVIWHHGGGIMVDRCPTNPAGCWEHWWAQNEATFSVRGVKASRRYSNYPNYGIYRDRP